MIKKFNIGDRVQVVDDFHRGFLGDKVYTITDSTLISDRCVYKIDAATGGWLDEGCLKKVC